MGRGKVGTVRAGTAGDNKGPCRARGADGPFPPLPKLLPLLRPPLHGHHCSDSAIAIGPPGRECPPPCVERAVLLAWGAVAHPGGRGAEVCKRARGGVRCAPRRRAQGERCAPALAVQRRRLALPSGAAAALPRPSQLASAARREGQDLFPYEGGSRARAAPAGVVWGRGEEGAGTALCFCPTGGAGRSLPEPQWHQLCLAVGSEKGCCRGREQAAESIPAEPACQAGSGSGAEAARSPSRCTAGAAAEAAADRTSPGEEPRWTSFFLRD
ncbi:uncharacterized protein LOC119696069 [Motacilla alba alba]|uniref:uncharacterized protein LOC119696069 n=1 Tax=Motacilla alba alba TaxID=1094192 RepID=UPI0018D4F7D5|nr:uncharacterized protein LOC119696069 [Motacilla alba alba]